MCNSEIRSGRFSRFHVMTSRDIVVIAANVCVLKPQASSREAERQGKRAASANNEMEHHGRINQ